MGLFNFYRRFVKGFAQIAAPLNKLLKKDVLFKWISACEEAFQMLKNSLVKAPILAYPDMSRRFSLTTDASQDGLGYILGQKDPELGEVVIAYGGRGLRTAEKNYYISEIECLAVIEGIKDKIFKITVQQHRSVILHIKIIYKSEIYLSKSSGLTFRKPFLQSR